MTAVLEAAEEAPPEAPPAARPHRARLFLGIVPWLFPAYLWVFALLNTATPGNEIALYSLYLLYAIVVPGTLVHRALRGSRGNLPEDLGLGAATGLVLLLGGWALAAWTGRQDLLIYWPALFIVPFVAVPGLWRHWHWRKAERQPLPLRWSWIIAAAMIVVIAASYPAFATTPLPPVTTVYYQDLLYHLSLIHEMTRSMPFQVPQVVGDTLRYHYLSDSDMAAASMITGIAPTTVLLRLWIVPVAAITVLVTAALARQLSGKWWAGALGGAAAVIAMPLSSQMATSAFGGTPFSILSPSQTYALPLLGLLLTVAVDVLAGRPPRWAWLLIFPVALACAGAKSSALPPFVAGSVAATLVVAIRLPRRLLATLGMLVLVVGAMLLGLRIFAGGGAGTLGFQPLAIFYWFAPYRRTIGQWDIIDGTQPLPYGVEQATTAGSWFLAGLVLWWLLMQAPRVLGIVAIGTGQTKREPAAWLLAGMVAAGSGGALLLWHPSASQMYFFMCAAPFGTVLTAWLLADQARSWRPVLLGVLAGGLWALYWPRTRRPGINTIANWNEALWRPLLWVAVVGAAVALTGLFFGRLVRGRFPWRAVPAGLIAAVLGAGLVGGSDSRLQQGLALYNHPWAGPARPDKAVTQEEMTAALWLNEHAGANDVIATNVHCQPLGWTAGCDARAFWVAGLAGRRTVIESWGYTDQALAQDGVSGMRYALQPPPYPERFELNQRVFAEGDPADVAELKRQFGVRWLFADQRAFGGVSPLLARSAQLRFVTGPVAVYYLA